MDTKCCKSGIFSPVVRLFTALGQPQGKHVETVKISRGGIQQNHRAVSNNMPESCVIVLKEKKGRHRLLNDNLRSLKKTNRKHSENIYF